jgi:hypothetical protein
VYRVGMEKSAGIVDLCSFFSLVLSLYGTERNQTRPYLHQHTSIPASTYKHTCVAHRCCGHSCRVCTRGWRKVMQTCWGVGYNEPLWRANQIAITTSRTPHFASLSFTPYCSTCVWVTRLSEHFSNRRVIHSAARADSSYFCSATLIGG